MLVIIEKILKQTDITEIKITDAREVVHSDSEENEYDLQIQEDLNHGEIQAIDELLSSDSNVEMRLHDGQIEIFEVEPEEEAS